MQPPVISKSSRQGALAVLRASSVTLASTLFFPGVLVRVASQLLLGSIAGIRVTHKEMLIELGGEVELEGKKGSWTLMFCATILGPLLIGSLLLFPIVVRSTLLDVRPFASISVDPTSVASQGTSLKPFWEIFYRFGTLEFLRLWFGVSCFYCCVPSAGLIASGREEIAAQRLPARLLLSGIAVWFRFLVAIDSLLLAGFAGAYLASGLIMLLVGWRALGLVARLALGG